MVCFEDIRQILLEKLAYSTYQKSNRLNLDQYTSFYSTAKSKYCNASFWSTITFLCRYGQKQLLILLVADTFPTLFPFFSHFLISNVYPLTSITVKLHCSQFFFLFLEVWYLGMAQAWITPSSNITSYLFLSWYISSFQLNTKIVGKSNYFQFDNNW